MRHILILFIVFSAAMVRAQDQPSTAKHQFDLGLGFGLDYGGIGARGTYLPTPALGLFGSAGYNFNALGWNVGAQWLIPASKNYFFFTGMYGYNAVLTVEGIINDKATYYGFSGGVGYQFVSHDGAKHWNLEVLVPVRNSNFEKDFEMLRALGATVADPFPVTISLGYHFRY